MFCMVHDVWTTKGNQYAFIGASVSYINDQWKYIVNHLTLKLIISHHKGKWLAEPLINVLKKNNLHDKISLSTIFLV